MRRIGHADLSVLRLLQAQIALLSAMCLYYAASPNTTPEVKEALEKAVYLGRMAVDSTTGPYEVS